MWPQGPIVLAYEVVKFSKRPLHARRSTFAMIWGSIRPTPINTTTLHI
jgi:hypothetical protein